MHALNATAPGRRARLIVVAAALGLTALIAAASSPSPASACAPITNCLPHSTYTFVVSLSGANQSATGIPGDPGATGSSTITMSEATNNMCASTSWSGVRSPVVAAHIHGGAYGKPENPAVTLSLFNPDFVNGKPSPQNGCMPVPSYVIDEIRKCPAQFNVVVHSQLAAWGAIRGQLGTTCTLP
jgi:hypothetical protein